MLIFEKIIVDGSKFKAYNYKRRNYSKKKLDRNLKYIEEKIFEYMELLEENDRLETVDIKLTKEEIQKRIKELKLNYQRN